MTEFQSNIWKNIRQRFEDLRNEGQISGDLSTVSDTFSLSKTHRQSNTVWFSDEQLIRLAHGEKQAPDILIHVVSERDKAVRFRKEMKKYQSAGVRVIWQIYPESEEVVVFHGKQSTTCTSDDTCFAAPALPEFTMKVSDIFKKPV